MKTILYIEEKPIVRENLIRMMNSIGFFKVLTSSTVFESVDLLEKVKVDLILIGRQITSKDVALLKRHLKQHRDVKMILTAETKSLATMLKAFENKIQFERPLDLNLLFETLVSEFGINYGGQLYGISPAAFLQMIELEAKTCRLKVSQSGRAGLLYCENGRLVDAQLGESQGKDAALAILGFDDALIEIDYDHSAPNRTIRAPLMGLLLESGRIKDEAPHYEKERRYKRVPCSLPVQFFDSEWSHEGLISDISLRGVFLETKGPFSPGKEIQVALHSPSLDKGCRIKGVVVRREPKGVGVEFLPSNTSQISILRTIIREVQTAEHV